MLKSKQKLCSIILAVVLLFSNVPAAFAATKSASHDLSKGAITLTAKNGDIRVYGSYDGYGAGIIVKQGYKGTITLDNVSIDAKRVPPSVPSTGVNGKTYYWNKSPEEYSAIYIDINAKVVLNIVGENKINGEHIGVYNSISDLESELLITGTGVLEIDTLSDSITDSSDYLIIDAKSVFNGGISAKSVTINKETVVRGKSNAIDAGIITINAETTVTGNGDAGIMASNLIINAKTTANGNFAGIVAGDIIINAETYSKGKNGIYNTDSNNPVISKGIIIKADTTAIGTNGYGVFSYAKITVDNATLKATGSKRGTKIGQGQKNNLIGNGKINSKTSK